MTFNGTSFNSTVAAAPTGAGGMMHGFGHRRHMMMHMAFYWGKNAIVLFPMWPGSNPVKYAASLALVFALGVAAEFLSHTTMAGPGKRHAGAGVGQTVLYTMRCSASYMLMLAVMSFNGGIFIAAMAGMGIGFFFFGSRAFAKKKEVAVAVVKPQPSVEVCAC